MATGNRVKKSILNAKVNLLFYFLSLFLAFFSRKIFLDNLGSEFIGLTGTLGNILNYLNLAELGIGACISFFLYKPLQVDNQVEIQEILSVFGYLYRRIGQIILIAGIAISLFFPLIFGHTEMGMGIVYFAFYSLLGSSLIGYFINYRQILLTADQKNYLVAMYMQSATILKTGLQIFLAYTYRNLYFWVAVEFLFSLLACLILNWKINKEYPWLRTDKKKGRELLQKYPDIITNTKRIFIHKIKDFVLGKSDELFIFAFVSLKMVAYYGNYSIVVVKVGQFFSSILDGVAAGVGNLIAENDKEKIMKVFWELTTIRHFVAGVLCFSIYHFIEPFIKLWLGAEYILDHEILVLLVLCMYINASRGVVDMYNHAHGLYADVWAAWTELVINVVVTFVAGYYWGIAGILLGKIASMGIIVELWKPCYLFRSGLHLPYKEYWIGAGRNFVVSAVSFAIAHLLMYFVPINPFRNFGYWICFCAIGMTLFLLVNIPAILLFCRGGKDSLKRLTSRFSRQ